jgi:hypothetical protein
VLCRTLRSETQSANMTTTRIQEYGAHGPLGEIAMVVIIESLPDGQLKTGQRLRDDLELIAISLGNIFAVRYVTARSSDDRESLLDQLRAFVVESGGIGLCLHIECHGGKDGIELADGSQMSWTRLGPLLANINRALRMNLILWLACCFGGYFVLACRYHETAPFVCIVGPGSEISQGTLLALTCTFYTELFRARDVTTALTIAGSVRPDISFINFSAIGVFRVALAARIKSAAPESRARIRAIEEPLFDRWRRIFFALDEFPENADRFAITYAEVLAWTMHEGTAFHGHAYKFGDVEA